ncbi:MAG: flavin reductase family protein, partial [Candidatus Omnitrophota bacterium]
MEKVKIDSNAFGYPMPVVLVGSVVDAKPNFLAAAWVSRVNYKPPLIAVAIGKHYTNGGIRENKSFSVNIPSVDQIKETDYCGIVSGRQKDKSAVFEVFYGELKNVPLIKACPVVMECRLVQEVELGFDTLFIGEIVNAYSEERFMTGGSPDIR